MAMALVSSEHAIRLARPCRRKQQGIKLKLFYIFSFERGLEDIYQTPSTLPLFNCDYPAEGAEVGFDSSAHDPGGNFVTSKKRALLE